MLPSAIPINLLLMHYCRMLLEGIPEERMAEQPMPGVNHPAWILGHLAFSAERARGLLDPGKQPPAEWLKLYGPGSTPRTDRGAYPSRDELLDMVERSFERLRQEFAQATPEQLAQPTTNPHTKDILPTVNEWVAFLLAGHPGVHLGQLSSWRRMIGLPQVF